MNPIQGEAMRLHQAGYCVLPVILDGSKTPDLPRWKPYKKSRPTEDQVRQWFFNPRGICVIGGHVSAYTEFFDFDDHKDRGGVFEEWIERLPVELIRKLVIYRTPSNGWRAAYRSEACYGAAKLVLAKRTRDEAIIELLAAHIVLVPGGDVRAHPGRKPYAYVRGHLCDVMTISPDERSTLIDTARRFNHYTPPERPKRETVLPLDEDECQQRSAWFASDDFNLRAKWEDVLEPHEWVVVGQSGDVTHWRRPGKHDGVSATTNYAGLDLLHVFTSSSEFESERSYSKYAAYAVLNHEGDFSAAAKELARLGYGRANNDLSYFNEKLKGIYDD
jgi:putative DNA primase/helicase